MRSASRPASHEPSARPPMKTESTVDIASAVEPNTSVSSRVHTPSKTRPEAPDKKKQARTSAVTRRRLALASRSASFYKRWQPVGCGWGRRDVTVALVKSLTMPIAPAYAGDEQALVD